METQNALKELLSNPTKYKLAGLDPNRAAGVRFRLQNGNLSHELAKEILLKAGYKIAHETEWISPSEWDDFIK